MIFTCSRKRKKLKETLQDYAAPEYADEEETVLLPGCRFKVVRVAKLGGGSAPRYEVVLKEVPLKIYA